MPNGIILMKWDERSATEVLFKYPDDDTFKISNKTLLHVLNLHGFSKNPGISSLTTENINFITYYSGLKKGYYIILVLNMLESPEDFEKQFKQSAQTLMEEFDNQNFKDAIISLFKNLK